jgi:hypothetical protein
VITSPGVRERLRRSGDTCPLSVTRQASPGHGTQLVDPMG